MNTHRIDVLVVDDHSLVRDGIKALLSTTHDMAVAGEASNGQEAIAQALSLEPDMILMDLSMPVMNGTEAIRHIKQRSPLVKIIALTFQKSTDYVHAALNSGADGYVLKDDTSHDLLSAMRNVMNGKTHLSPGICDKIVPRYLGHSEDSVKCGSWSNLTVRERQIMKMIAEGGKNREIALQLSISIKTVEKHRSNLMKKLDLHSISDLTAYAIEKEIVCL
jgi:DNA-binding NarL/FixJ family response regulator